MGEEMKMETYPETPQGVIAEHNLTTSFNPMKKRDLDILYISLDVSILLVVVGLFLHLMQ
jgi:hypothetical protein